MIKNNYILENNLKVKTYTIGFDPQGESILITICDGDKIIFAGLIDCFIDDDDYIIKLLDRLNIKKLNYLCITHPDFDHCIGISKIINRIDCNTKVAIPSRIFDFMDHYNENVKSSLKSLEKLVNMNSNNRNKPLFRTVSDNCTIIDDWKFYDTKGKTNELSIITITPSTNVVERYGYRQRNGEGTIEHNDLSIVNLIKIGELRLLLTGDAMNNSFRDAFNNLSKFGREFFSSKINFVKIPHHTSKGSDLLLDLIKQGGRGIEVSVTTIFRKNRLPNLELFNDYNLCSESVFCTGTEKINPIKKGIVLYEADITNMQYSVSLIDAAVNFDNYCNT